MSTSYVAYQPDQQYLMPCTLQEWLPQGHMAYLISDTVDSLKLNALLNCSIAGSRTSLGSAVQYAGVEEGTSRVQARAHGAQSAQNGSHVGLLKQSTPQKHKSAAPSLV